ncbi:ABC transporter ATP-binding protein [Taklimakanibacter lacteus]|uniref:ABC transporter ATP-binding protein n=1 Tax=Taklimakanibacter lacteus TaxID=2268456 RepID=UPI000E67644E
MSEPLLAIEGLAAGYEPGAAIVRGVSLAVKAGEIVTILGPNGAGKSTFIKAIAGLVPKFAGTVKLGGSDITRMPAHLLARQGLGFVPQTENVFTLMSIADNLRLAADILPKPERAAKIEEMLKLFPDLDRQRSLAAGRLSGGQRQMLAVARALIAGPRILMLDEASAGLSPKLVGQVFAKLADIRKRGITIVMVEQNAKAALALADRAIILAEGRTAHEGRSADIASDPQIRQLYLGLAPARGAA